MIKQACQVFTRHSGMACGPPKGTTKHVIAKLDAAVVETLADPAVRQRFMEIGQEIWPRDKQTPEALSAQQKAEIEKWWPIIKAANIRGE